MLTLLKNLNIRLKCISVVKYLFKSLGIGITSYTSLVNLRAVQPDNSRIDLDFILAIPLSEVGRMVQLLQKSKSQLRQDLFVLLELDYKKEGYFVEFGATDGINLSNSYLLEKEFLWKGILAEPAVTWQEKLRENRPNADIEVMCVWEASNHTLLFNETNTAELSTVDVYSDRDLHSKKRKSGNRYQVQTISLNDLLEKYNAPTNIDYLSIDTEGSEFEILNALDFDKYSFRVITCEHNYSPQRERIYDLLVKNGYKRKFENLSGFDDWYTKD
jgi:FkbM family methyltransferase